MKILDIVDSIEGCSLATQRAFEIAEGAGRFAVTVLGRRTRADQIIISALTDKNPKPAWAVICRNGERDYQIIESVGKISGFNETTLLEFAKACIRAVRFKHVHG